MSVIEFSISKTSNKVGLSSYTLRYYEKEGLIPPINRNNSGIRVYTEDDIFWIGLVRCLRDTGMSIADIREIVALSNREDSESTIPQRRQILVNHKNEILSRIEELQKSIKKIDKKIAIYDGKAVNCD